MKAGVFTTVYRDRSLDDALDRLAELGVEAVEIGTGNWPGDQQRELTPSEPPADAWWA